MMRGRKSIHFVALGDSLTVGFTGTDSPETYPYTMFLKQMSDHLLQQKGKVDAVEAIFTNKGVNGDLTSDMLLRFRRDVIDVGPDYTIILGGANDIGWGVPVDDIFDNLRRMFRMAADQRIWRVGCTVPSILGWDEGIKPRLELNEAVKSFCYEMGILCADVFQATCEPGTMRLRPDFSSDGLHLNEGGYKKIADTIYKEAIEDLLTKPDS
jgi:lysophospholipase L1-like esterase